MQKLRRGASLIDVIISLGIVVFLFGGIYLVYFSLQDSITNIDARTAATTVLDQETETIRDMPYDSVGVVGGIPSGVISPQQTVNLGNYIFTVQTTVRNIDDPFDGLAPTDTAPADYKLVEFSIGCPACSHFNTLTLTTTVAPKNLESTSNMGSLFINTFDALGAAVSGTTVHVMNSSVTPAIDLTDTTNNAGVLQLVGVPTSTQSYRITVSKAGYSSDRTYPMGSPQNPNPVKPHATVASGAVTNISFSIDKVSTLVVQSSDNRCNTIGSQSFTINGSKLIGTNPDVPKFSTSSATNASGTATFSNLEWDTYTLTTSSTYDMAGTIPFSPLAVNPNTSSSFRFVLKQPEPDSLLISAADAASGAPIAGATATLSKTGFFSALAFSHATMADTDWSGGNFYSQNGMDTSVLGTMKILANTSSTYSTSTTSWLISKTFDVGSSTATYYTLNWNSQSQPPSTGPGSVKFQLAANNDNATWNFVGPNGTAGTYYTASSTISGLNNSRYIRYEVFLSTQDANTSPSVDDVTIEFNSVCVPTGQAIFTNLSSGIYAVDVTAPQYNEATTSVSVVSNYQQTALQLVHQ